MLGRMLLTSPSVLSSWVSVLMDAVESERGGASGLLAAAGFSADALRNPNARHSIYDVERLWHLAAETVGDPVFGLRVPNYVRHTSFHALSSAVFASATVSEALGRVVRYGRVITDAGSLQLERSGSEAALRLMPTLAYTQRADPFRDSMLALNYGMLKALAGKHFTLRGVALQRSTASVHMHAQFFESRIERAEHDALYFDADLLALELPSQNPDLVRFSESALHAYLARLDAGSIVERTRDAIDECMSEEISPALVARKLGMSLRSLQRSLRARGSSYEQLRRDGLRELACSYLRDGRHSVTETAYALGYESSSAFARAFKRWTGQLPSQYQHGLAKRAAS